MDQFPPALPHGRLEEIFPDIFFVTGAMKTTLMNTPFQFSRNMVVVRDGPELTLINTIRLDDAGLAQLDALGRVANLVKIGSLHGRDDAFYKAQYAATFWAAPGMTHDHGLVADRELRLENAMPFMGCSVFGFRTTKTPECILHINRAGGILVAADALMNLVAADEYFSEQSRHSMREMGFFQPANFGPVWFQINEPNAEDFVRLLELPFQHAICGHGPLIRNTAKEAFMARFKRVFGTARS